MKNSIVCPALCCALLITAAIRCHAPSGSANAATGDAPEVCATDSFGALFLNPERSSKLHGGANDGGTPPMGLISHRAVLLPWKIWRIKWFQV